MIWVKNDPCAFHIHFNHPVPIQAHYLQPCHSILCTITSSKLGATSADADILWRNEKVPASSEDTKRREEPLSVQKEAPRAKQVNITENTSAVREYSKVQMMESQQQNSTWLYTHGIPFRAHWKGTGTYAANIYYQPVIILVSPITFHQPDPSSLYERGSYLFFVCMSR